MLQNIKITRNEQKELIRDTLIDFINGTEKDEIIELIVNQLTTSQRKTILSTLEEKHNREMTKAALSLGFIEEEGLYCTTHVL